MSSRPPLASEQKVAKSEVHFKLLDSIVVLERREFQKKATVLQLNIHLDMDQSDETALKLNIANESLNNSPGVTHPVSEMHIQVLNVTPYIVDIREMERTKFKNAHKRILFTSFDLDVQMKSSIQRMSEEEKVSQKVKKGFQIESSDAEPEFAKFGRINETKAKMTQIQA